MKSNRQELVKKALKEIYGVHRIVEISSRSGFVYVEGKMLIGTIKRFQHQVLQARDLKEYVEEPVYFEVYFDKLKRGGICVKFKTFNLQIPEDKKQTVLERAQETFPTATCDLYDCQLYHSPTLRPVLRIKFPELP